MEWHAKECDKNLECTEFFPLQGIHRTFLAFKKVQAITQETKSVIWSESKAGTSAPARRTEYHTNGMFGAGAFIEIMKKTKAMHKRGVLLGNMICQNQNKSMLGAREKEFLN